MHIFNYKYGNIKYIHTFLIQLLISIFRTLIWGPMVLWFGLAHCPNWSPASHLVLTLAHTVARAAFPNTGQSPRPLTWWAPALLLSSSCPPWVTVLRADRLLGWAQGSSWESVLLTLRFHFIQGCFPREAVPDHQLMSYPFFCFLVYPNWIFSW